MRQPVCLNTQALLTSEVFWYDESMINTQRGSLKWIFIIVIAIIVASFYFDFSIQEAVEDEQTQSNFTYIWNNIVTFYNTYLADKVNYLWNDVFIDLIWDSFTENMQNLKTGELTSIETAAPTIEIPE